MAGFNFFSLTVVIGITVASTNDASVTLSFGKIHGNFFEHHKEFLGIPYAAPPVRFAEPKPWTDAYPETGLQAHKFTAACVQPVPRIAQSEDCLHLNVYTPHLAQNESVPVMLWIHGGALISGTAMDLTTNASNMVSRQGVVVVTINYRLNVLGFAVTPLSDGKFLANNGFRDQRMAIQWVRTNIHAFGGLNKKITIFGESAGGQSVFYHVISRGSKGLFDAAIAESSDVTLIDSVDHGRLIWDMMTKALKCNSAPDEVECMRNANATLLTDIYVKSGATPATIDGDILSDHPIKLVQQGNFNRVPVMMGTNEQEGDLFTWSHTRAATVSDIECAFGRVFDNATAKTLMNIYNPIETADNRDVLAQASTDFGFACPARELGKGFTAHGMDTWVYAFKRRAKCAPMQTIPGAYHSEEIMFVFDAVEEVSQWPLLNCGPAAPQDIALGHRVSELWATFAKTFKQEPAWRPFGKKESTLRIDIGTVDELDMMDGYRRGYCNVLWPIAEAKLDMPKLFHLFWVLPQCQASKSMIFV